MDLETFLTSFFTRLNRSKIRHCILRNYEGLPFENPGNDIDILIMPKDADKTLSILNKMDEVVITGITKRPYVISVFINGVFWGNNFNAIQIDLVIKLGFKGIPFLSVNSVLSKATKVSGAKGLINKPSPADEAVISFFSSYLIGGWIKVRYWEKIRSIFKNRNKEIIDTLSNFLPSILCLLLVESVIKEDKRYLIKKLPLIRRSLILKKLSTQPFISIKAIANHYIAEIIIRFTPRYLDTICLLGPDGSGKSSVISEVSQRLKFTTKQITCKHLKPQVLGKKTEKVVTNPHAKPPRSKTVSTMKILSWLLLYWFDHFLHGHKNCALIIWDRYYHDLLVDPMRYRYGGSLRIANIIAKLVPQPDIFILLDAPATILQARKQEVSFEETARQRESYIELINRLENGFIVDTSQNIKKVVEDTQKIIINLMAQKTRNRLDL